MRKAFISLLILPLAGCDLPEPSETMIANSASMPPSYVDGFNDGCHSGRQAAGDAFEQFRKDQRRFEVDRDYARGWSDAFRQCETQTEARARQMRSAQTIAAINAQREKRFDNVLRGIDTSGLEDL